MTASPIFTPPTPSGRARGRIRRILVTALVIAPPLVVSHVAQAAWTAPQAAQPGFTAASAEHARTPAVGITLRSRTIAVLAGYRRVARGLVLDAKRFTTVASLTVPAAPVARSFVLGTTIRVAAPIRIALSVRAWCDPPAGTGTSPAAGSADDVLVIGQNPVPGGAADQVASRTVTGRAVVDLPAGRRAHCRLQVSPRTESTSGSRLRLLSGRFTATAAAVVARSGQRQTQLVGPLATAIAQVPVREVARLGPVSAAGAVRVDGEAELTTCALGYHRCPRGTRQPSVADVRLRLIDVDSSGRPCRTWLGSPRRVTISAQIHHLMVLAPAAAAPLRCGQAVRGALEIRYRSGDAVEVEPSFAGTGGLVFAQTHLWITRA